MSTQLQDDATSVLTDDQVEELADLGLESKRLSGHFNLCRLWSASCETCGEDEGATYEMKRML